MIEAMWIWAILGLGLIGLELTVGTFYLFCFGLAALLTAGITGLFNFGLTFQLLSYIVFTPIVLGVWHAKFKNKEGDLKIGQSIDETVGKIGHIVATINREKYGYINFSMPVMGAKNWMAVSEQTLRIGELAKVVSVEGNYLKVERCKEEEIYQEKTK